MNISISRPILGIVCIAVAVIFPVILGLVALAPREMVVDLDGPGKFMYFNGGLMLTCILFTTIVNILESVDARRHGGTSLEQLPRDAATLLTGTVGMVLIFVYLLEAMPFPSRQSQSPTLLMLTHALGSTVLLMEGICLLARESLSGEKREKPQGD